MHYASDTKRSPAERRRCRRSALGPGPPRRRARARRGAPPARGRAIVLAKLGDAGGRRPFLATKVWTRGRTQGIKEMSRSFARMRTERMDLMQIHNLLDWQAHLPVLRDWKSQGPIRYIGITHYAHGSFPEMEKILRTETVDFVQLPYNVADREAEKRLLPVAEDTGTAVLVMRPFDEGELLRRLSQRAAAAVGSQRARLHELVVAAVEAHPRSPRGHVPDPGDLQPRASRRQTQRREGTDSR